MWENIERKKGKGREGTPRNLWDYKKRSNICNTGVQNKRRNKVGAEKVLEEIITEIFPYLRNDTDLYI